MITKVMQNGVRVAMQPMAHVRSVSMGVWVNTGSVRESAEESGASHFIEHMVFKGTARRTAEEIAAEMDAVGGSLNAFTSKECTCFYAKVLDEQLELAADILSDIVFHSTFPEEELEKEKGVVVEEILMTEDTPEDLSAETANMVFFGDEPLASPILGTEETVRAFTRSSLKTYQKRHYVAKNIVIACAGHFEPEAFFALCEKYFDLPAAGEAAGPLTQAYPGGNRISCIQKDIEQAHITLMLPGAARDDEDQFPLAVLSNVIGGSMSSRLFQKIREQRGLAYSVYSYPSAYTATGTFSLYAGTGDKQAVEVTQLMLKELADIHKKGITDEEFKRCKAQLKGSCLLGMESSGSIMNAIGKVALLQNREYSEEETIDRIECVTMEDIQKTISRMIDKKNLCACFVGRINAAEKELRSLILD